MNIDPRNIVVVSIMPCTAKKFEAQRPEMDSAFDYWKDKLGLKPQDHFQDVDFRFDNARGGAHDKRGGH